MIKFEELDETTRRYMLAEFETEEATKRRYRSDKLSAKGLSAFPDLVRAAILQGDETSLTASLSDRRFWRELEMTVARGVPSFRRYSIPNAAEGLGLTEFNTWYVRGLARRLMEEGQTQCQVYHAAPGRADRGSCVTHEDQKVALSEVYGGHRAHYWPKPGDPQAFSIPAHTFCYHTIRRLLEE